jgi:CheY-like chemotaxis protein
MPEMDGYEATERIREFNKNIPILALTAVSFVNIKDKCEEVGMD